jgi:hypothetical protein
MILGFHEVRIFPISLLIFLDGKERKRIALYLYFKRKLEGEGRLLFEKELKRHISAGVLSLADLDVAAIAFLATSPDLASFNNDPLVVWSEARKGLA